MTEREAETATSSKPSEAGNTPSDADAETGPTAALAPAADPLAAVRGAWGFPAFAQDFPPDAELAALVAAFAAGDYATVRTGAPALAAKTKNDDVRRAAEQLRARIEPDPSSRLFFGLTAALLVFLFAWWALHDGPQHGSVPPVKPPAVERVN